MSSKGIDIKPGVNGPKFDFAFSSFEKEMMVVVLP
jgi:hypothetical protein